MTGMLATRLLDDGRRYWRGTTRTQRILFHSGTFLFVWMLIHGVGLVDAYPRRGTGGG